MRLKQISFTEALELAKANTPIYVITNAKKPIIHSFNKMAIGDVLKADREVICFVIEEECNDEK